MRLRLWVVGKIVLVPVIAVLLAVTVMLLWNAVMPTIFIGASRIDFWHAAGLLILSRVLFGGFRGHAGLHRGRHWRKWQAMTPEERAQVRESVHARHGWKQDI